MNKIQFLFKKHSSTFLTIISSMGVISTTLLAIQATPKAIKLLEDKKEEKDYELSSIDIIKTSWKPYIPTIISGFSTIICIFGTNYLNKRTQASIASAYALLSNSYQEYINKTKELYGDEADTNIKKSIIDNRIKRDSLELYGEKKLFFDYQTMRYFESTFDDVLHAEDLLNQELAASGYVSVNDFYKFLGLNELEYSNHIGWSDNGDYHELKFEHQKIQFDDGLECWMIIMEEPLIEYYDY